MIHEHFMQRCLRLARSGIGNVAPNPMVGCVIVKDEKIIGEGYHHEFGKPHAEVNAINSVKDQSLLKNSTLYVNLEPCSHYGKTPPCADLIIQKKIPVVVIGGIDPFEKVSGKGIEKLRAANIEVICDVLKAQSVELNKRFFTFHIKQRPYIILKWAQSADGFIASNNPGEKNKVQWISNKLSRTLVHKWRSEEQAIMIGTNTAMSDNPILSTRDWKGKNPLRIVFDRNLKLQGSLNIFKQDIPTVVFTSKEKNPVENLQYIKINFDEALNEALRHLYKIKIQSVIVEGGSRLLDSFIKAGLWDEARIFSSNKRLVTGIAAPHISGMVTEKMNLENDSLTIMINKK